MDTGNPASTATLPWPALTRKAVQPAPRSMFAPAAPKAPCADCGVRHLCLGGVEDGGRDALDGLTIGRRRLRKGQVLYRAGEPFEFLFAVRVGTLEAGMAHGDGLEHVAAFHFAGDIVGFDGLAAGKMPSTLRALENAEVCSISYAQLGEACAASKDMWRRVSQLAGRHIVREYRAATLVRRRLTEKRVAGFLLAMSETMHDRGYSAREFHLRMSRAGIASYLGTALETVSRALSQFDRQGWIRVRSRQVELLQIPALRAFAEDPAQA